MPINDPALGQLFVGPAALFGCKVRPGRSIARPRRSVIGALTLAALALLAARWQGDLRELQGPRYATLIP